MIKISLLAQNTCEMTEIPLYFDDLHMDADTGQDNDNEIDSVDSDYDDRNLRMNG